MPRKNIVIKNMIAENDDLFRMYILQYVTLGIIPAIINASNFHSIAISQTRYFIVNYRNDKLKILFISAHTRAIIRQVLRTIKI